ncbi:MAG: M24 family metallopeptidase [Anaerolineales bacterium]|nr:M24 family metallopeptidase [Anaerolineales bacterium]
MDVIRPGITLADIFAACYQMLLDDGALEWGDRGAGLDMNEPPPSTTRGCRVPVQPGLVFTVEPIAWDLPDARLGNFALEAEMLVTAPRHQVLSTVCTDLFIL